MPGPYDKFEAAFETFQEQLRKELHDELETLRQSPAATPQVTQEVPNLHDELAAFREELLTEVQTLLLRIPQEKPNPLAFYETILKINTQPLVIAFTAPPTRPYFADVFNDVVRYFGGQTSLRCQQFLAEARKRFAYLTFQYDGKEHPCLLEAGYMNAFDLKPGTVVRVVDDVIVGSSSYVPYTQHEFDVLRELLEDFCTEAQPQQVQAASSEPQTEELAKKIISSDLANLLERDRRTE